MTVPNVAHGGVALPTRGKVVPVTDNDERGPALEDIAKRRDTLVSLQIGRGFAALAVVLFHATAVVGLSKYWGTQPLGPIFMPGNSGVYYFFVLSGFIIAYAHSKDVDRPSRWRRYLVNRFKRVYPMYWIVTIVALAAGAAFLGMRQTIGSFNYFLGVFTLMPFDGDHGVLAVAWTLFHEICFYIIFSSLILSKKYGIALMSVWGLGCLLGVFLRSSIPFVSVLFSPINLLFFFGIGAFYSRGFFRRMSLIVGGAGLALYALEWASQALNHTADRTTVAVLLYGTASGLIVWAFAPVQLSSHNRLIATLRLVGDASYSIYLTHFLTISLVAKILYELHNTIPAYVSFWAISMCATLAGMGAYISIERPIIRAIRMKWI